MGESLGFPSLGSSWPSGGVFFDFPSTQPGTTPTGAPNGQPSNTSAGSTPWWQYLLSTALSGLVFWRQSDLQAQAIKRGGGVTFGEQGRPASIGSGAGIGGSGIWTILIVLVAVVLIFKLLG